ncbi:multidrug efflux system membrane fusion protein [Aminobacter niigataensis]|uniref:Multidrug efflux system membrane fusion protein n=1 Tax=Aminobacter niigataensis TaxID=83265 RepID=A0ABR6L1Y3_9HYPH|nr:efflux RND transporter periplasmic adaptor subunit [Aminobacter niigataensis]MBB4650740.1 multidrug efflux system membrane fusion protein [Aminobacter niigataensis]
MSKIRFHKLAALVVLVGFAAWMGSGKFSSVGSAQPSPDEKPVQAEQPKAPLRTVMVVAPPRLDHARAIRISGQTEANKRATLATRAAGIIAELPVKQGDHIKQGDLVLMLDAEEKTAAVDTAKAVLVQRKAEWEATEKLMKAGSVAKLQADGAWSNYQTALSQLQAAESELSRNQVKAPFDGVVDRVAVELGSSVIQGGEVATILNLDPILGKGEISERDLRYVKIGDEAEVKLVNGEVVTGKVRYISRDATSQTRTFPVEIAIPNADGAIPAGMTAEITVRAKPVDAVMLPRSVVTLGENGDLGIRAVDGASKVVFYPIDLVDDTQNGLVLGGIPATAQIIIAGQDLVKEGDEVKAEPANEAVLKKLAEDATGTQ